MLYRLSSLFLALIGIGGILLVFMPSAGPDEDSIGHLGVSFSTLLVGILNYNYLYEAPRSHLPKYLLLGSNGLYIGFLIWLTSHGFDHVISYVSMALALITTVLILNKKV